MCRVPSACTRSELATMLDSSSIERGLACSRAEYVSECAQFVRRSSESFIVIDCTPLCVLGVSLSRGPRPALSRQPGPRTPVPPDTTRSILGAYDGFRARTVIPVVAGVLAGDSGPHLRDGWRRFHGLHHERRSGRTCPNARPRRREQRRPRDSSRRGQILADSGCDHDCRGRVAPDERGPKAPPSRQRNTAALIRPRYCRDP